MSMKPAIVLKAVEAVQSLAAQGIAGGSIWWETATLVRTFFTQHYSKIACISWRIQVGINDVIQC
ncbi:MAG: hypothetical protein JRG81_06815 [Deltaproteobacteria bacterium]|nr:hypothetical protein [Deltaproteobacteria bacterium]